MHFDLVATGKMVSKWEKWEQVIFSFQLERHFFFAFFVWAKFIISHKHLCHLRVKCAFNNVNLFTHIAAWYISIQLHKTQTYLGKMKISSNFPLKLTVFVIFMKSKTSTPFFYFIILRHSRQTLIYVMRSSKMSLKSKKNKILFFGICYLRII